MHAYFSKISAEVDLGVRGDIFCKHIIAASAKRSQKKFSHGSLNGVCVFRYHCWNIVFRWAGLQMSTDLFSVFVLLRPCLVSRPKTFHSSHRVFGHMYGALNIDENKN